MKKLEDLGISPAPWKVDDRKWGCDNEIRCEYISDIIVKGEKRTKVVASCNAHFDTYKPDARLIAASPKLYEWLAFAVEHYKCETRSCDNCPNGKCWVVDATAALAEAAGER